ncbi:MAG: alpha/beta hydrolase [Chloroflexi bacterium]|nr:alpha/beta hydrolase [Chloroflexota bacterium]
MQELLDIDGHQIAVLGFNVEKGSLPFIFIHGILASVQFWPPVQTPLIRQYYTWYALSLPGHYPSRFAEGFDRESLSPELVADIFAKAIRKLVGKQRVVLVGHSTGGFSALTIAAHAPELVHAVVSVAGFASGVWTGGLGIMQNLARNGASLGDGMFESAINVVISSKANLNAHLRLYAADAKALYNYPKIDRIVERLYESAQYLEASAMLPWFSRMPDIDIGDLLPHIAAPTLVVVGDKDPIVPADESYRIAKAVPYANLVTLKGVGHLPMFERPNPYHRAIQDWISFNL